MAQSKKHYLKTLEIIEQDKSLNEYLALTYFNIAVLYYEMGDLNRTVEYSKKRLKAEIDFPSGDASDIAWAYFELGEFLVDSNKSDEGLENFLKCLEIERTLYSSNSSEILGTIDTATDLLLDLNHTELTEMISEGLGIAAKLRVEELVMRPFFITRKGISLET